MAKPKMFGTNAAYIPNNSRDLRRCKKPYGNSRQHTKKTKNRPKSGAVT